MFRAVLAAGYAGSLACSGATLKPLPPPGPECAVVVSGRTATFYFPPVPTAALIVHPASAPERFEGAVEYFWGVSWDASNEQRGIGYRAVNAVIRRPAAGTEMRLNLREALELAEVEVVNEGSRWADDAISMFPEPDARVIPVEGRVTIQLRGGKAVRRYLGWRPGSARFHWRTFTGIDDECTAPITYM